VAIVLVAISGCIATSRQSESPTRPADSLQDWQASGRIAVSGPSAGGSGSFTWTQTGGEAAIQIRGPVGIGNLRLYLSDRALRIETSAGQRYVAAAADAELAERLGAQVPTADLRYWLAGVAAPGEHRWTDAGAPSVLLQHEWRVEYQRYGVTSGVRLPMKLIATSGPAKVRIVIDKWVVK